MCKSIYDQQEIVQSSRFKGIYTEEAILYSKPIAAVVSPLWTPSVDQKLTYV